MLGKDELFKYINYFLFFTMLFHSHNKFIRVMWLWGSKLFDRNGVGSRIGN
jgi:hypothetical protein